MSALNKKNEGFKYVPELESSWGAFEAKGSTALSLTTMSMAAWGTYQNNSKRLADKRELSTYTEQPAPERLTASFKKYTDATNMGAGLTVLLAVATGLFASRAKEFIDYKKAKKEYRSDLEQKIRQKVESSLEI